MKPRILFFPFPLMSHYTRCLMLAKEVKDDYEIFFRDERKFFGLIQEAGFRTFDAEDFDAEDVLMHSKNFSFEWMNQTELEKVLHSQVKVIKELKPDLVIGDACFSLKMAAEMSGVKMLSLINGYMSRHYALTRKISRTHPAYRYSTRLPSNFFDSLTRLMEQVAFRRIHQPFRRLRKKFGLKKVDNYLSELEGDHTLICDLPELFPQTAVPANFSFIGPLFYEGSDEETELIRKLIPGKKTILVSLGSSGDWNALRLLNEDRFSCFNIITSGDSYHTLQAPHIISRKFLNNMAVLSHCDLMICHGGNGTVYQALQSGISVLARTSLFEQEWNIQQLQALVMGESINDQMDRDSLISTINRWVEKKPDKNLVKKITGFKEARQKNFKTAIQHLLLCVIGIFLLAQ